MSLGRTLRQKFPFFRYSFLRGAFGGRDVIRTGQMGDGREEATADYVVANAPAGDVDAAIDAIDDFAYDKSILMNVGDEKGQLLDTAVKRANPKLALELVPTPDTAGYRSPSGTGRQRVLDRRSAPTPRSPAVCGRTPASPIASPALTARRRRDDARCSRQGLRIR